MNSRKRQASRRKPKSKSKRVSRGKKQVRSHRKYSGARPGTQLKKKAIGSTPRGQLRNVVELD
jgi:hypothetical protein